MKTLSRRRLSSAPTMDDVSNTRLATTVRPTLRKILLLFCILFATYAIFIDTIFSRSTEVQFRGSSSVFRPGTSTALQPLRYGISEALKQAEIGQKWPVFTLDDQYRNKVECVASKRPYRCSEVHMHPEQRQLAKAQWMTFVAAAPPYPNALFSGKGIVLVAGGPMLFLNALTAVKSLRQMNCTLPIELWCYDDEYPSQAVVANLNKDEIRPRKLGEFGDIHFSDNPELGKRYHSKILSIIGSSFEEILFLDADNFAISDPSYLFDHALYNSSGAILWSDFWEGMAPQDYLDILGLSDTTVNGEGTFESGQLLFNKAKIWKGLMAVLAFNMQSDVHYMLPTCGMCGAGDKETFGNGLRVLNMTYYKVARPRSVGRHHPTKGFLFAGALQWRPEAAEGPEVKPLFFHHMGMKLDITTLNATEERVIDDESRSIVGFDLELQMYSYLVDIACGSDYRTYFSTFVNGTYASCEELRKWLNRFKLLA